MITFCDLHCDTITYLMEKGEMLCENRGHIDINRFRKYDCPVQAFAICLDGGSKNCFFDTVAAIEFFKQQLHDHRKYIGLATNYKTITDNKRSGRISAILAVEGGEAVEGQLENVEKLYEMGVRIFTLTWNTRNEIGCGVLAGESGLTPFGFDVIKLLSHIGMLIDVSHINDKGFWDVAKATDGMFIASHSNCRSLCGNPRNLTDEQIKEIATRRSVIGVNYYPMFLNDDNVGSIDDIVAHINHIVKIGGIDTVAIGSDFDGVKYLPPDVNDVLFHQKLYNRLITIYGKSDTEKIMGLNMLRVFKQLPAGNIKLSPV